MEVVHGGRRIDPLVGRGGSQWLKAMPVIVPIDTLGITGNGLGSSLFSS